MPAPGPTRRRRWPTWVAAAIALILVVSVGAASYVSYTNGEEWKERSQEWEARAESLESRLVRSEADAESLEGRLDDLANEKAQAQDERNTAETQREIYEGLASLAADAAVDVAACQNLVSEALRITLSQVGSATPALSRLESMVANAEASCAVAEQSYREFADAVNGL